MRASMRALLRTRPACVRIEAALHPSVRVPSLRLSARPVARVPPASPTCNRANGVHTRKSTWQVSNAFTRTWTRTEPTRTFVCVCVCVRARAYCYEKRARSRAPSVVVAAVVVVVVVVVTTRIQARGTTLCRRLGVCMHIRCIHCTPTRDRSLRSNSRGRDSSSSSTSSNFSTAARLCFVPQFLSFFHLNSISSRGKNDK